MKNPNGFGTCYKLSGRRRKPFVVVVPDGRDENGKLIRKVLGHYATRKEGIEVLARYNESPFEFIAQKTFSEIYTGWHADKFYGDYSLEREHNYEIAYNNCSEFHDIPFTQVRLVNIQAVCDKAKSYEQAYRIKLLINQMSEWAIDRDYALKNYAKAVTIKQTRKTTQKDRFSDAEIKKLFSMDSRLACILQVFLYTGCRRSELLNLRREDVNIDEHCFYIRKAKTSNGVRVVPIHDYIYKTFITFYNENNDYVFSTSRGQQWTDKNWDNQMRPFMVDNNINHTTHETRHTFISLAVAAGLNQTAIKKIVGHTTEQSLTEQVYTHLTIKQLLDEVNRIPSPDAL